MCFEESTILLYFPGRFGDEGREVVVPTECDWMYRYRICLEERELGMSAFMALAMVVHCCVPWSSMR